MVSAGRGCYYAALMYQGPRWNSFDTAYSMAGLLIFGIVWAMSNAETLILIAGLTIVAYAAGRAAGSHR